MKNRTLVFRFYLTVGFFVSLCAIDVHCENGLAWGAPAQVAASGESATQAWVRRYNGPGNKDDEALAMAVDSQGNIIVTGYSTGAGTDWDFCTIKYSPTGEQLWMRRYNGPGKGSDRAQAIAVDTLDNVCVAGYSLGAGGEYQYTTIKYSPRGRQLWVRRDHIGHATAIALDGQNNIYVTGLGFRTIKYNPAGQRIWVRHYRGSGRKRDDAHAIAVDREGNAYVSGRSGGYVTGWDYATTKYSPTGKLLWVRVYNGPVYWCDYSTAIALDGQGNVHVTGVSWGFGYSNCDMPYDYATIKYSPEGKPLWLNRYDGPANCDDDALAIALDQEGNVFVTGGSVGGTHVKGTAHDYATIKYGPTGEQLWLRRYNGPANDSDIAWAITTDDQGNCYVTGGSHGSGGWFDYYTIKYGPNGQWLWSQRYNGSGKYYDHGRVIKLDGQGNVYVTGGSYGARSGYDFLTIKYTQQ